MRLYKIFTRTKLNTKIVQCVFLTLFLSLIHSFTCSALDLSTPVSRLLLSNQHTQFIACAPFSSFSPPSSTSLDTLPDYCSIVSTSDFFYVPNKNFLTAVSPVFSPSASNTIPVNSFIVYDLSFETTVSRNGDSDFASCINFNTFSFKLSTFNSLPISLDILGTQYNDYSCRTLLRVTFQRRNSDFLMNRYLWLGIYDLQRVAASSVSVNLINFSVYTPDSSNSDLLYALRSIASLQEEQLMDNYTALKEQQKQTQLQQQQTDFVTNTDTPDADSIANADSLPSVGLLPAGPLDSILLLPLNIMNSILSSLGGSCTPVVAPLPFVNKNITFPCFGDTIYKGDFAPLINILGISASAFILFGYFKHLYKKVDRAVSLETSEEDEWGVL